MLIRHNMLSLCLLMLCAVLLNGCGGSNLTTSFTAQVSTLAGSASSGLTNGTGANARFNNPVNLAIAPNGNLIVCDFDNGVLRQVTPTGVVTTVLQQTGFMRPFGIAIATDGTVYVQTDDDDAGNHSGETGTIWKVNVATGSATVLARDLGRPRGLAVLADGRLVFANLTHNTVQILNPQTDGVSLLAGADNVAGFANGTGAAAQFNRPYDVAVQHDGSILVVDQNNFRIRKVTLDGVVTTFAGTQSPGTTDGPRLQATFSYPQAIAIDNAGVIYVTANHVIRSIDLKGNTHTIAGNNTSGFMDGPGLTAQFYGIEGIDIIPNGSVLYAADGNSGDGNPYNRIRKVVLK